MANDLFAAVAKAPAVQSLQQRVEEGGALSCAGVSQPAQPFLAELLGRMFPERPIVVVTAGLKTQESFHQDITTWLQVAGCTLRVGQSPPTRNPPPATCTPLFYPAWEILPHEDKLPHVDVISERLEALVSLTQRGTRSASRAPLIVTSAVALLQRTYPPEELRRRTRTLERAARLDPLDLIEWLEEQGYEPEAQVTQKGEIALRGGILDAFPPSSPWPVRLEFFGDELESLRYFDPLTQMSREEIGRVTLPPAGELSILKKRVMGAKMSVVSGRVPEDDTIGHRPRPTDHFATLLDYLPREAIFLFCEPDSLAEHAGQYAEQVPTDDPFFVGWKEFASDLRQRGMTALEVSELEADKQVADRVVSPRMIIGSGDEPDRTADAPSSSLSLRSLDAYRPLGDRAPEPQIAEAQRREFFAQLHRWLRQGYAVHIFCNNEGERQRFSEIWDEYGFRRADPKALLSDAMFGQLHPLGILSHSEGQRDRARGPSPPLGQPRFTGTTREQPLVESLSEAKDQGHGERDPQTSSVYKGNRDAPQTQHSVDGGLCPALHLGALARGFLCHAARIVVATDAEIFGRYKVQRPRRLKSLHATAVRSALDIDFTELEAGDYAVHVQHGIGRYLGLKVLPLGARDGRAETRDPNSGQECLVIEYAPTDPALTPPRLYVPVTEAHLVSKYVGAGKARPTLNTLGGARWIKAKAQAEKAVRDLAGELLAIQAARESQPGHACTADAPWQGEFESAFVYEETPDQIRAIRETKADMEKPKPMDRLICGDVGFGKTEVAVRAAFKAVLDGKQVAVLVPTTVLAQQHFNTFRERTADYPVRVELLSRFRTRRQQQRVIKDLASGAVDIVIGTHRLVQDDVQFKDVGLVIIDEEQRFGVLQKEKFKQLRRLVDVLTLSATPIPRTLYLALTGARDMSTIETPPQDRLPIETIVTQYDERVIRDAIRRELNRGGQVFFLHNRVMTIDTMAQKLRALAPHARIVVGHGQMHADDLEEVMTRFVNGEADLLLSTTIIESGLDIPNANTIIIDRADRFGLSDLYQLRGRVGRYKHQAYAYLLLPRHAGLLSDARKRISAIKQYSTLGSGFKIAMRDLEIRGAGNLLGPEQSGHITAVGFDLYCQLLKQSIASLKGEKVKPRVEVQVRFDFLALSPEEESSVLSDQWSVVSAVEEAQLAPDQSEIQNQKSEVRRAAAYVPFGYISDSRQRIEVYRKLAQAIDTQGLERLGTELRDRFGPLPAAMESLLQVVELKILASDRAISVIETKEDKLMLTRNGDLITLAGKFPRLTKKEPKARLIEIKKLLLAL